MDCVYRQTYMYIHKCTHTHTHTHTHIHTQINPFYMYIYMYMCAFVQVLNYLQLVRYCVCLLEALMAFRVDVSFLHTTHSRYSK